MKNNLFVLVLFMILISCSKDENESSFSNACNSDNPLEISWLKEIKNSLQNCTCEISIIQGTYDDQTVFFTALTDPLCDGIDTPTLFDCEGNAVRTFTINDYQDFYNQVTRDEALYRCKTTQ